MKKNLILSHLPKAGGTYINRLLKHIWTKYKLTNSFYIADHDRLITNKDVDTINIRVAQCYNHPNTPWAHVLWDFNINRNDTNILGMIRNPFDYYLSCWASNCEGNYYSPWVIQKFGSRLYSDSNNIQNFQEWLPIFMNSFDTWAVGRPNWHAPQPNQDVGVLSYRVCTMYHTGNYEDLQNNNCTGEPNHMLINEGKETKSLENGLINVFSLLKIPYSLNDFTMEETYPDKQERNGSTCFNRSNHKPYQEYYTDKLRQLVEHKDRFLFQKYNFKFD